PMPSCFRLLTHWVRRAASRAAWTAGKRSAMSTAMMAMTTSNSISVNPRTRRSVMVPPRRKTRPTLVRDTAHTLGLVEPHRPQGRADAGPRGGTLGGVGRHPRLMKNDLRIALVWLPLY